MAERDQNGVLARWSRRKAAARRGELGPEAEAARAPAEEKERTAAPADMPVPEETAPDLPDPDTLDASADFKAYLKPGVPPELKTRALRRLWRVDPFYSRHDGLDDCCGDFTDQARVVKNLKTVYRVGRGMIDRITEAAEAAQPPAEGTPQVAGADEPRESGRDLPIDHEPVSEAGAAVPVPGEPTDEPLKRPAAETLGRPRRLPRRG